MTKARVIRFETQTLTPPEMKRNQRASTQANTCRNNGSYSGDEKTTESDQKKLVTKLIEFLQTV